MLMLLALLAQTYIEPTKDARYSLGSPAKIWGGGKAYQDIYIGAPHGNIIIMTEDGKRVVISAEEVKRRAKR